MDVNFNKAEAEWIPLIGQFILDFAFIEDSIHTVISDYLNKSLIKESYLSDRIETRIELFEEIIKASDAQDGTKIKSLTAEIKNLRPTRNLLAHNALGLVYEEKEGVLKEIGFEITAKKKTTSIKLDSLKKQAARLTKCRDQLTEVMIIFLRERFKAYERELPH